MIEIQVFASLTDYYQAKFFLQVAQVAQEELDDKQANEAEKKISDIFVELEKINPKAKKILATCRVALNEEFCSLEQIVKAGDRLFVFPPFSGG